VRKLRGGLMSRTGMPAEPLDVRRSLPKLCFFSLLWLPILSLGPVLVLASNGAVAPAEEEWIFGVQPLWWLAVALSAYAVWHFVLLWKALGARGTIIRLSPEGLSMPSLGSMNPIPWPDVEARNPVGLSGMFGFVLDLKVDPAKHAGIAGASAVLDDPARRGRVVVRVPSVLSVREKDILRTVQAYKAGSTTRTQTQTDAASILSLREA
jgi:hypothetical protein